MPIPEATAADQTSSRFNVPRFYLRATMLTLSAAAALLAPGAHAQTAEPAAPAPQATASQTPAAPRYSAQELERAFNFIDANHDGKISREEAAGFRGVAKYFDEADLNKDNFLSREEFDNAMNGGKSK
ncbi:hypothetical protein [Polaromonas jejuensis]|uniref:EF-hand domain-containing protein n=1 Tax=Polaromonas jejuensis TaxID=457502 RepID=A0ABW0QED4_9BURK|nr:hypothetical protein [Polaromonas jejuensis]